MRDPKQRLRDISGARLRPQTGTLVYRSGGMRSGLVTVQLLGVRAKSGCLASTCARVSEASSP
jgi:hypothetical protein